MFCEKCGSPLAAGEAFCGNCGAPVASAPQQAAPQQVMPQQAAPQQVMSQQAAPQQVMSQQAAPQYDGTQFAYQQAPQKQPKKSNKKRIAIIAGAVVACLGIFVVIGFATGLFKSWFGKSDEPVDVTREVTTGTVQKLFSFYNTMSEEGVIDELKSLSLEAEIGDALKIAAAAKGYDVSWVNSVRIDTASDIVDGKFTIDARLSLNGQEITTLNLVCDLEQSEILIGMNGICDSVLRYPIYTESMMNLGSAVSSQVLTNITNLLDESTINLVVDYLDTALSAFTNVSKTGESITAAGVTAECDEYTIKISQRDTLNMEKAVLTKAANDPELKKLIERIYQMMSSSMGSEAPDFEQYYESFKSSIDEMLKALDGANEQVTDDTVLSIIEYIKDEELVGMRFVNFQEQESSELFFGTANDGEKFGVELTVNGQTLARGSGTVKDDTVLNGSIDLMQGDDAILTFNLIDFDSKTFEGTIEIPYPKNLANTVEIDEQSANLLETLALRINLKKNATTFDLAASGASLIKVKLGMTAQKPASLDTSLPVVGIEDMQNALNIDALKSRLLAAGMPQSMIDQITATMGGGSSDPFSPADSDDPFYGEDNIRLTVWAPSAAVSLTKELCDDFIRQYPQKTISIDILPVEDGDCSAQLLNDPSSGADVFSFPCDQIYSLDRAMLLSYPYYYGYDEEVSGRDAEAAVEAASIDGYLAAYPETGENGYYLIYDKRYVSDADAKTLEGVLAACRKAGKKFIMDAGNGFYACTFMFTGGVELDGLSYDGSQLLNDYDEEKVLDTLEAFNKLFAEYKDVFVSDNVDKVTSGMSASPSTVAAGIDGSWNAAKAKLVLGDNYGAVKLPTINVKGTDVQMVSMNGYKLIGVNNYTKFPEAAQLLAKYLSGEEGQIKRAQVIGWSPSNRAALAAAASYLPSGTLACLEQADYSVPQNGVASTFWNPTGSLGKYIATGGKHTRAEIKAEFEKAIANIKDE